MIHACKINDALSEEARCLQRTIDSLRAKHVMYEEEMQDYVERLSSDQSEIKQLSGPRTDVPNLFFPSFSLSLSYTNTYTAMFSSLVLCMLFTFVVNYLGELDERMAELEESRRKLVNLRMQKEGSSALHVPVSMSNGSSMSDKLTEKNIGLRELKDSIEEAKVGRKFTHFHFPYSILLLLSVGLFISVSFNELCRHWQLLVFQNCRRQRMQI